MPTVPTRFSVSKRACGADDGGFRFQNAPSVRTEVFGFKTRMEICAVKIRLRCGWRISVSKRACGADGGGDGDLRSQNTPAVRMEVFGFKTRRNLEVSKSAILLKCLRYRPKISTVGLRLMMSISY